MAIELSRNVTFGQYLDRPSVIHRLDPRTKIIALLLLIAALLIIQTFTGYGVLIVGILALHVLSRIPLSYILRGMRLLFLTIAVIYVIQVLFYRSATAAESMLWQWGVLSISLEGLLRSFINVVLRVICLYYLTSLIMFTTNLMDLAHGLEVLLSPLKRLNFPINEMVMIVVVALKFVPILVNEFERLIKAQAARGQQFNKGSIQSRARKYAGVLLPILINAFQRADVLAMAMEARGYRGGQGRTTYRELTMRWVDRVAMLAVCLLVLVAFVLSFTIGV